MTLGYQSIAETFNEASSMSERKLENFEKMLGWHVLNLFKLIYSFRISEAEWLNIIKYCFPCLFCSIVLLCSQKLMEILLSKWTQLILVLRSLLVFCFQLHARNHTWTKSDSIVAIRLMCLKKAPDRIGFVLNTFQEHKKPIYLFSLVCTLHVKIGNKNRKARPTIRKARTGCWGFREPCGKFTKKQD